MSSKDRAQIAAWFRLVGNMPDASYVTPGARRAKRGELVIHKEHLVPVRVFADRLLEGTLLPREVRSSLCIVTALGEENSLHIEKLMGKGGPRPIYKALLACPPKRLVEVASWRYLAKGIRLDGVGRSDSVTLDDRERVGELVQRYARKYDSAVGR